MTDHSENMVQYSNSVLEQCVDFLDKKLSSEFPLSDRKKRIICSIISLCNMSYDLLFLLMYTEGEEHDAVNTMFFEQCVATVKDAKTQKLKHLREEDLNENHKP